MDIKKFIGKFKIEYVNENKNSLDYYYYDKYNNEYIIQVYKEKNVIRITYEDEDIEIKDINTINKIRKSLKLPYICLNKKYQTFNKYDNKHQNQKTNNNILNKYYEDIINSKYIYW